MRGSPISRSAVDAEEDGYDLFKPHLSAAAQSVLHSDLRTPCGGGYGQCQCFGDLLMAGLELEFAASGDHLT
jgi:hypothetical protein